MKTLKFRFCQNPKSKKKFCAIKLQLIKNLGPIVKHFYDNCKMQKILSFRGNESVF